MSTHYAEIKSPALRYFGGKFKIADWIMNYFPRHNSYIEPCGGAASVLLQKEKSQVEIYNDIDGNVVNFFRVLRDRPQELMDKIKLTPWARKEFDDCKLMKGDDLEKARCFYVVSKMGFNSSTRMNSKQLNWRSGIIKNPDIIHNMQDIDYLGSIANRLLSVQIECMSFFDIVPRYDHVETLFYVDPPYVHETRNDIQIYAHEWTDANHIEAADLLRQCAGYVVVSGYACSLYIDLYEKHGWHRVDKESQVNGGAKRIESLWLSPRTWDALRGSTADLPIFAQ